MPFLAARFLMQGGRKSEGVELLRRISKGSRRERQPWYWQNTTCVGRKGGGSEETAVVPPVGPTAEHGGVESSMSRYGGAGGRSR
ncbi:MAG: hypothetical protein MZV70_16810 [Desulfobacterales bacterium]|nr:hypothetical protein [Desulfobacterales bacterium]